MIKKDAFKYYHGSHLKLCNTSDEVFKPEKFDVVIISEVLEHIDSNLLSDFVQRLDCVLNAEETLLLQFQIECI